MITGCGRGKRGGHQGKCRISRLIYTTGSLESLNIWLGRRGRTRRVVWFVRSRDHKEVNASELIVMAVCSRSCSRHEPPGRLTRPAGRSIRLRARVPPIANLRRSMVVHGAPTWSGCGMIDRQRANSSRGCRLVADFRGATHHRCVPRTGAVDVSVCADNSGHSHVPRRGADRAGAASRGKRSRARCRARDGISIRSLHGRSAGAATAERISR